jgi:hypothetical protein
MILILSNTGLHAEPETLAEEQQFLKVQISKSQCQMNVKAQNPDSFDI